MIERKAPYRNEPDLVGRIGFRELNYGGVPDGKPLDPAVAFRELASEPVEFEAEPMATVLRAYGKTKLLDVLFTLELAERLEGTGVTANCCCPGLVATGLAGTG